jgi:hypothetical protein
MPRRPPIPPSKPAIPMPPPECETPPLQQAIPWRPVGLSDAGDRILELRLFYEYTKSTSNTPSLKAMAPVLAFNLGIRHTSDRLLIRHCSQCALCNYCTSSSRRHLKRPGPSPCLSLVLGQRSHETPSSTCSSRQTDCGILACCGDLDCALHLVGSAQQTA